VRPEADGRSRPDSADGATHSDAGPAQADAGVPVAGLPLAQRSDPDLPCQPIGGGEVAVTFHERASDHQHRVVRRDDLLRHPNWHSSMPARTADEVVPGPRPCGAPTYIGEDRSPRVRQLDGVVAAIHIRHMQHVRPFAHIEPSHGVERVAVASALQ
jgi:hypothetical protein